MRRKAIVWATLAMLAAACASDSGDTTADPPGVGGTGVGGDSGTAGKGASGGSGGAAGAGAGGGMGGSAGAAGGAGAATGGSAGAAACPVNSCKSVGQLRCNALGLELECVLNANGCLEWHKTGVTIDPAKECELVDACEFGSRCTAVGKGICLEWQADATCPTTCAPTSCKYAGELRCNANGAEVECVLNANGCLEWKKTGVTIDPTKECTVENACQSGSRCKAVGKGICLEWQTDATCQTCTSTCAGQLGQTKCENGTNYECKQVAGGCMQWQNVGSCCVDSCGPVGTQQCTSSGDRRVCEKDAGGCLKWFYYDCNGAGCTGGTCNAACKPKGGACSASTICCSGLSCKSGGICATIGQNCCA